MDDRADVVAVGVEHVGAVVADVLASLVRPFVIAVAGGERDTMELVDGCPVRRGKREFGLAASEYARGTRAR